MTHPRFAVPWQCLRCAFALHNQNPVVNNARRSKSGSLNQSPTRYWNTREAVELKVLTQTFPSSSLVPSSLLCCKAACMGGGPVAGSSPPYGLPHEQAWG